MDKQTLGTLFNGKIFSIPDYQRGYAWEKEQCKDFVDDIDALVIDRKVKAHYTGTIVTYVSPNARDETYNRKNVKCVDIVDGQQRLTTVCLYLSVIIKKLISLGVSEYSSDIPEFLYHGETCKIRLNNETAELFYQLLKDGQPRTSLETAHQKRLYDAFLYFQKHIDKQLEGIGIDKQIDFVKSIFEAITGKLVFTYYSIEEECEIGMTFELMNSRGKDLSVLELLKNYLMHWIARNGSDENERSELTSIVNRAWKDTYNNVGHSSGNEKQCLRIAWTLYCHHLPKNWKGYEGFKDIKYIPLRDFSVKTEQNTKEFLVKFSNGLASVSQHYSSVVSPSKNNVQCEGEYEWLCKIHNTSNIANFLPLIVATRINLERNQVEQVDYLNLLKAIECYIYRVFIYEGKRSNTGQSNLYRWGKELFDDYRKVVSIQNGIYGLIEYYAPEKYFLESLSEPANWYITRHLLKYTLFEYELHLLKSEGKNKSPALTWHELTDVSTFEHILPQTIDKNSKWRKNWTKEDIKIYLHDIANIILTQNNSNYQNFDFDRKKGIAGTGICYANSDIRQERKIASYDDWNVENLRHRRKELITWISNRWRIPVESNVTDDGIIDFEDDVEDEGI